MQKRRACGGSGHGLEVFCAPVSRPQVSGWVRSGGREVPGSPLRKSTPEPPLVTVLIWAPGDAWRAPHPVPCGDRPKTHRFRPRATWPKGRTFRPARSPSNASTPVNEAHRKASGPGFLPQEANNLSTVIKWAVGADKKKSNKHEIHKLKAENSTK